MCGRKYLSIVELCTRRYNKYHGVGQAAYFEVFFCLWKLYYWPFETTVLYGSWRPLWRKYHNQM